MDTAEQRANLMDEEALRKAIEAEDKTVA